MRCPTANGLICSGRTRMRYSELSRPRSSIYCDRRSMSSTTLSPKNSSGYGSSVSKSSHVSSLRRRNGLRPVFGVSGRGFISSLTMPGNMPSSVPGRTTPCYCALRKTPRPAMWWLISDSRTLKLCPWKCSISSSKAGSTSQSDSRSLTISAERRLIGNLSGSIISVPSETYSRF